MLAYLVASGHNIVGFFVWGGVSGDENDIFMIFVF